MYMSSPLLRSSCIVLYWSTLLFLASTTAYASTDLATAAYARTSAEVVYDGSYRRIDYPNGDVPAHLGVCTDVVIRAYRALEIDLQQLVHEDISANFTAYPNLWGLSRPDPNIDHRRVPNLETFFGRHGTAFTPTSNPVDYRPGDIVSWRLDQGLPHIGIVSPNLVPGTDRHYIVHNIGRGPQQEDVLFSYRLNGHFRYRPTRQ